jgi:hypothetical protein
MAVARATLAGHTPTAEPGTTIRAAAATATATTAVKDV